MPSKTTAKKKIDKKSVVQLKKELLNIKEKILSEIKKISDAVSSEQSNGAGDVSGHAQHMADVATDMYDREFSLGLASNDRELLYKVDEALMRIDNGEYGACEGCGKAIAIARIKAIPYAKNCLGCQEKIDAR